MNQSYVSNELTHFVGRGRPDDERYALLLTILGHPSDTRTPPQGWLQASYRGELGAGFVMCSDGLKPISTNKAIRCTMLCFCDIPPGQLAIHMAKYGSFGVAFPKSFLRLKGATPVYYVPRNARNQTAGVGPQNVADRFDNLHAELQGVRSDLEKYVSRIEGHTPLLSRFSPPGTPEGHRLRGRFEWLHGELEELIFARIKFFQEGLPEDHLDNYYMEREWRLHGGLAFRLEDLARIYLPQRYRKQFHEDVPDYKGAVDPPLDGAK